jgi:hypothetical protein
VLLSALRANAVSSNELAVTPSIRSAATALRSVEGEGVPFIGSPVLHFMASRASADYARECLASSRFVPTRGFAHEVRFGGKRNALLSQEGVAHLQIALYAKTQRGKMRGHIDRAYL